MKQICFILFVICIAIACKKDEPSKEEKLVQKEKEIIDKIDDFFPAQVTNMLQDNFKEARNEQDFSTYLDSFDIAIDDLINTIETNFSIQEYKETFGNTINYLQNSQKSTTDNCLGLAYAKGLKIEDGVAGSAGLGIIAGLQAAGGGGVKVIYDFVNLDRQIYSYSFCSCGYKFGIGASAALSASVGFSGINEIITGIRYHGNELGKNRFEGQSLSKSYSLSSGLATLLGIQFSIGIGTSSSAVVDFSGIGNLAPCPSQLVTIENGIKGYSFQVAGSISATIGSEISIAFSKNDIGTNVHGWDNTYKSFGSNRPLASIKMATEILCTGPLSGFISIPGAIDIAASTVAIAYGLKSFNECPKQLSSIGTNSVNDFTANSGVCGGIITNDGGTSVNDRGVCWDIKQNPTTANNKISNGKGTGTFTCNITGLSANTTYYVRAYATNSVGTAYGNEVSFTTKALNITPAAAFIASKTDIAAGQSVQFTDQSTNNPTSWSWNFGDGGTSTSQNPSHTYNAEGIYTVSLLVKNSSGSNTKTISNYIKVNPVGIAPLAAFIASSTTINVNQSVQFTDQSTNNPTSWSWNFGDGGTSTSQNPSHTYSIAGTYTVTLTASNSYGSNSKIEYLTVLEIGGNDGTFIDSRDGNSYKWVKIGNQVWMAENLSYLPLVNSPTTESYTKAYYYVNGYDGSSVTDAKALANFKTYGVLYNWPAAMDGSSSSNANPSGIQGVCPSGWHLPSDAEWTVLTNYLGGASFAGGHLKESTFAHWLSPNTGADNSLDFTALPGGYRVNNGSFDDVGKNCFFWSSSQNNNNDGRGRWIMYNSARIDNGIYYYKEYGFSVRCLKD